MYAVRYVTAEDRAFWFSLDNHLSTTEFDRKVRDRQGYVLYCCTRPIGILRYNLFWDSIPFLNLIFIEEEHRRQGGGKALLEFWEAEMRAAGYKAVLVSTQADEEAQYFYRKLNYRDCGCLIFNEGPLKQPTELFLYKAL